MFFFHSQGRGSRATAPGWDGEATGKARKESSLPSAPVLQKTGAHVLKGRTMVNKAGVENVHCGPRGRPALASLRTLAEIVRVWRCRHPAPA